MAEALLQLVLETVASLVKDTVGYFMGLDKEMEKLQSTLTAIQAVLEDAEDKQFQSKPIQDWLKKLNDTAYEIEDILDEYVMEVSKRKRERDSFNFKNIPSRLDIGKRMKEMAGEVEAIAAECRNFHLNQKVAPQSSQVDWRRKTGSLINEPDHICGRDGDRDKIVDILVNQVKDCEQLSVLPIIGLGGLGKTTLAQLVFNDQRVRQYFDTKLWVCVSDNFDLEVLLKAMIEFATEKAPNLVELAALEQHLWKVLNQKKYLIILDDVWNDNQEDWAKLKRVLACGSKGASVVVTTRLKKVADIMGTLQAHCLEGLSEEHSWLLFKLRAFGPENEEYPKLESIGRQIVKKCAGVPLATKALGGLLRFKRDEKEWTHVRDSKIWNLPEEDTSILPVLRLSYHHLPSVLRRCFAYCAVYPKDSIIEKQDLIFRWMAYGCISSNEMQEVEDVGDQIWNELVLRSFFQEVDTRRSQVTCKMHDLVHDLAVSIMENKFPRALKESSSLGASSNSKIREVYVGKYHEIDPSSITLRVSTLTTITNYCRLRILKIKRAGMVQLPSAIGKLKHLRYFNLLDHSIRTLPDTFCDLWNLRILILVECFELESLPKHITKMTNLRHIILERCNDRLSYMPSRIGELTSLKSLSLFIVGHEIGNLLDELEHLNLGGKLEIKHLERVQNHLNAKKANLVGKPNLRVLVLLWEPDFTSELAKMTDDDKVLEALEPHSNLETLKIDGFRGSSFPLWMTKMENVTKITVLNCKYCSRLPPMGDLPQLKYLDLGCLAALEYIDVDEIQCQNPSRAKFPSLEVLELSILPNLKGLLLKKEVGEMFPNLRRLHIESCQLLMLRPLLTLEKLEAFTSSPLSLSSFSYKLENLSYLRLDFDRIDTTTCFREDTLEGLCNLKGLAVWHAGEQSLPEKWFQDLKSLKELEIGYCNIGSCVPEEGWLRHLTALEELRINYCKELVQLPEEIKYLHLLKRLRLQDLNKMKSLPQVLQHIPSLQSLQLDHLRQLISLPDWLGNLTSLTDLVIGSCSRIPSLPSSIKGMKNLRFLSIVNCPKLETRCKKENGEDWHKIAHIPRLQIGL